MALRKSVVSASGAGGFVLNTGTSGNTSFELERVQAPGTYVINSANGDSALEFYLIAENGSSAGYSNTPVITATSPFSSVVLYGAGNNDTITVDSKEVVDAAANGDKDGGAAPFITSVNTTDLPNIDDTIIITGGNFATDVTVTFTGTDSVALNAKSIVRSGSTQLLATRPDAAIEDNAPYTVTITNPGIPDSTIKTFTQEVTVGGDPAWQTPPSQVYNLGVSNTITLVAADTEGSDIDYAITAGSLPAGLTLDGETGVISGTPSGGVEGDQAVFTVRATDAGGNIADREFTFTANTAPTWTTVSSDIGNAGELSQDSAVSFQFVASGGSAGGALSYSVQSGSLPSGTSLSSSGLLTGTPDTVGTVTFTLRVTDEGGLFADKEFIIEVISPSVNVEYLVIAGGGGSTFSSAGGGGGGGYRSSVSGESSGGGSSAESALTLEPATNYTVTVGGGGTAGTANQEMGGDGSNSVFSSVISIGGGGGSGQSVNFPSVPPGRDGGSGGGGARNGITPGSGTANQGFDGGNGTNSGEAYAGGGGGGAGGVGGSADGSKSGNGGAGVTSSITGGAVARAGGGAGSLYKGTIGTAVAGGGAGARDNDPGPVAGEDGVANTGGGGGGGGGVADNGHTGGSGIVILRYPNTFTITIGSGLTGSETTVGANKVATITAGTGNVSFS